MTTGKHSFSIEMTSKEHMNRISVSNEPNGYVLFEGELGELIDIQLVEGILLQITGDNGIFRIDLTERELSNGLLKKKVNHSLL